MRLGLAPLERFHGGISPELALVGTFPQLEYPRRWPAGVEVTGPMTFEVPHPEIELPPGDGPLVLVAPSTAHDSHNRLVRTALAALADEPVRVVATTNRVAPQRPIEVPDNAILVDWLSYTQLMPAASLVVSHGGHGTVARALGAGTPLLICPFIGDMSETAMRVAWAKVGLSLPWRLTAGRGRCAGRRGGSSTIPRSRPVPASSRPGAVPTTALSAAPSSSRSWPARRRPPSGHLEAPGVGLEPTTPRLTAECSAN